MENEVVHNVIKLDREFKVPVEMLYEAFAGLAYTEYTAVERKIDFRVGGRYSFKTETGAHFEGSFLEIEKNKKIVMTWETPLCAKATKVTMEFGPWGDDKKHSYVELIHEGFSKAEEGIAHHMGWNIVLEKIQDRVSR